MPSFLGEGLGQFWCGVEGSVGFVAASRWRSRRHTGREPANDDPWR